MVPGVAVRNDRHSKLDIFGRLSRAEKRKKREKGKNTRQNAGNDDGHHDHDGQVIDCRTPPPPVPDEGVPKNSTGMPKEAPPNASSGQDPLAPPTVYSKKEKDPGDPPSKPPSISQIVEKVSIFTRVVTKFARFVGPGFLVAVAYIDPGNYSTDAAAGAAARFKLLFVVLLSNMFAIFLQSLCVKLGSVTGLNLAENCRKHLPKWLNITLYIFAEAAIIATDIAEVRNFIH